MNLGKEETQCTFSASARKVLERLRPLSVSASDDDVLDLFVVKGENLGLGLGRKVSFEQIIARAKLFRLELLPNSENLLREILSEFGYVDKNSEPGEKLYLPFKVGCEMETIFIVCSSVFVQVNPSEFLAQLVVLAGSDFLTVAVCTPSTYTS